MNLTHDVNEKIKAKEVRLVGIDGAQVGVVELSVALQQAYDAGVDLVQVNGNIDPPLCRIVDYGKFKYELTRDEKDRKKRNRENAVETKEIQLRPVTDNNDLAIKAKRSLGFLEDGDKVKVVVKFKGRELSHREMGNKVMDSFLNLVGAENYKVDSPISMNGRQMMIILASTKK